MDAPADPAHLLQVIAQLGSDDLLMFSTDYPHFHFPNAEPQQSIPSGLSETLRRKILSENARAFYKL